MKRLKLLLLVSIPLLGTVSCEKEVLDPIGPCDPERGELYTITMDSTIGELQNYFGKISQMSILDPQIRPAVTAMVSINLKLSYQPAHIYTFEYSSTDPSGQPVRLSSALILPQQAVSDGKPVDKIVLANHFSMIGADECPTHACVIEGLLAWGNYAVILPDYYGFGASGQYCQSYLDSYTTARGNIDALNAAFELLEDLNVDTDKPLVNMGYSQGGFNAMANLKYVSQHQDLGINFDNTLAGGGPYNVVSTFEGFMNGGYDEVFPLVMLTAVSFNECQNLGIDYADMFVGDALANWRSWFVQGQYPTRVLSAMIDAAHPENYLTEKLISMQGSPFDDLNRMASYFSLHSGWAPAAGTRLTLFHAKNDDMVPYSNYEDMKSFLEQFADSCDITFKESDAAGHQLGYLDYFMNVVFPELNK